MTLLFYAGLFLLSGATLMYEVVLTRLLSVISWYYLAFVSVSMAMFGMTAGAMWVQLRPQMFTTQAAPRRLADAGLAAAVSLPLALLTMLAIPIDISYSLETLYSFLLFTAVISVPFCFAGVAVCLALTRSGLPIGTVYAVDLSGAALGCLAAIGLLRLLDAPSAMLAISALLFAAAAAFRACAGDRRKASRHLVWAGCLAALAIANGATLHGIQPMWSKGHLDPRRDILAEIWNPISKVRVSQLPATAAYMWGAGTKAPQTPVEFLWADIDNDAGTPIYRFAGDPDSVDFLLYDVTSLAAQMRPGGSIAIIGMGGGKDVLAAVDQKFQRVVAIEVNDAMVGLATRRFAGYSGLAALPNLQVEHDEGRSYLTRTNERFDVIQAAMVDTWAATSAGALTLTENGLYTVEAWRIFYRHLKPGGLLTVSRWNVGAESAQTERQLSLALATLFSEGVERPAEHVALIGGGAVATILVSNLPLSAKDLADLKSLVERRGFQVLYVPGEAPAKPLLGRILAAQNEADLNALRDVAALDLSPTHDSAPFFFNSLRLRRIPSLLAVLGTVGNLRAIAFLLCFLLAAAALLLAVVLAPLAIQRTVNRAGGPNFAAIVYFVAIGLGFLLAEMAMMQQLSLLLGRPIYSLAVVLAGLILATGLGSFFSGKMVHVVGIAGRVPAAVACLLVAGYSSIALPAIHLYAPLPLWQRVGVCLALVAPCGVAMGFCFPVGLRRMSTLGRQADLPWMWALNGAASVLGSFLAVILSMETSLAVTGAVAACCYALAALTLPG